MSEPFKLKGSDEMLPMEPIWGSGVENRVRAKREQLKRIKDFDLQAKAMIRP